MNEKKFQVLFGSFLKKNPPQFSEVYELKFTSRSSMPFDAVKTHQIENLLDATGVGIYHKISDAPIHRGMRTRFTFKKPFDCLYVKARVAYVVILYYVPRAEKFAVMIRIEDFIKETTTSDRKSLTRERAELIAEHVVSLKGY